MSDTRAIAIGLSCGLSGLLLVVVGALYVNRTPSYRALLETAGIIAIYTVWVFAFTGYIKGRSL